MHYLLARLGKRQLRGGHKSVVQIPDSALGSILLRRLVLDEDGYQPRNRFGEPHEQQRVEQVEGRVEH